MILKGSTISGQESAGADRAITQFKDDGHSKPERIRQRRFSSGALAMIGLAFAADFAAIVEAKTGAATESVQQFITEIEKFR